jgi:hypothetical protein
VVLDDIAQDPVDPPGLFRQNSIGVARRPHDVRRQDNEQLPLHLEVLPVPESGAD